MSDSKQKVIVVDEDDNIIGHKIAGSLGKDDIYRVSALWITNSKGDILLAKRSFKKKQHPGKWGPAVAGTVDEGETYEQNMIKEAEEEIGLKGASFQKGPKVRVSGEFNYFTQWYFFQTDQPLSAFTIQEEEVEEIRWFSRKELLRELSDNPQEFLESTAKWVKAFENIDKTPKRD